MSYWCQKRESSEGKSLLQLVMDIKYLSWDAIETRLTQHPNEAAETDRFGVTPLFHVLKKRHFPVPCHIVQSLIDAHPQSLTICDNKTGYNALHTVCVHCDDSTLFDMILDANTSGAQQTCNDGHLPLHKAKSLHIAKRLVEVYPQGVATASKTNGYLPLHTACLNNSIPPDVVDLLIHHGRKQKVGEGGLLMQGTLFMDETPVKILFRRVMFGRKVTDNGLMIDYDSPLWTKLCMVAKATHLALRGISYTSRSQPPPLVHAILECGGNPKIVEHALKLHPDEMIQKDEDGRTPLAIAAAKVNTLTEIFDLLLNPEKNGNLGAASIPDSNGRLPLHLAVMSGRTVKNGVQLITKANPSALQMRDAETQMFPFMTAAVPTYRWDNTCLDTIFTLLRDCPSSLETLCEE